MVNKQKRKGTDWERQFVKLLERDIVGAKASRIAGSGAIGTIMKEPILTGDVNAKFLGFPRKWKFENKVGYGGAKQMTIQKEWFDKIKEEAEGTYSHPAVALKFSGARRDDGTQYVVALDFDTFCTIMNYVANLKEELDLAYERMSKDQFGNNC